MNSSCGIHRLRASHSHQAIALYASEILFCRMTDRPAQRALAERTAHRTRGLCQ
jgi:hypothetical protein